VSVEKSKTKVNLISDCLSGEEETPGAERQNDLADSVANKVLAMMGRTLDSRGMSDYGAMQTRGQSNRGSRSMQAGKVGDHRESLSMGHATTATKLDMWQRNAERKCETDRTVEVEVKGNQAGDNQEGMGTSNLWANAGTNLLQFFRVWTRVTARETGRSSRSGD
jgi:hypothetical protein